MNFTLESGKDGIAVPDGNKRVSPRPRQARRAVTIAPSHHAIASRRFRQIEPPVGAFEQAFVIRGVVGAGGKPDRDGDDDGRGGKR